jgi:hypothetical protein
MFAQLVASLVLVVLSFGLMAAALYARRGSKLRAAGFAASALTIAVAMVLLIVALA